MKTIKLLFIAILLLGTFGCELNVQQKERIEKKERYAIQCQKFITLTVGDTLHLTDYSLVEPRISYMNEYTTTYRVYYEWHAWYVTVYNTTKIVRSIRSIK